MSIHFLYIDPGSGSYLVQIIIGAILSFLFFFKNMWKKIVSFFSGSKKEDEPKKNDN